MSDVAILHPSSLILHPSTLAVVPVKHLMQVKTRLAAQLSLEQRAALMTDLLSHVLRVLRESGVVDQAAVVSPDRQVLAQARQVGAQAVHQVGEGLNPALLAGRAWANSMGAETLLVVLADLPLLTPEDIRRMIATLGNEVGVVLVPDRFDIGTNAMLLRPPSSIPFRFGVGSFARHQQEAAERGLPVSVYRSVGTAFDVDTPLDWAELKQLKAAIT